MRHLILASALALGSLALAACGDEITEPKMAGDAPAASLQALASNTWLIRAHMPTNRTGVATATVTNAAGQSIVYAIGGLGNTRVSSDKVTAYNVATNAWTYVRPVPQHLAGTNGAGVINGKIYVSGGYSDPESPWTQMYMYDPARNIWTQRSNIPTVYDPDVHYKAAAGGGVTGVIGGQLYVASGCFVPDPPQGIFLGNCPPLFFRYNPVTDKWVSLPGPFPNDLGSLPYAGGVIDGKFYVMGGDYPNAKFAVYDPATNQWTPKTPLGVGRPGAATAVLNGKLYVMGGQRYNAARQTFETVATTVVYDPATDTWTPKASLPSPRTDISASKVLLAGQPRIEVVGGLFANNNVQYVP
jgi:N-acetylneuraminic acid mutarotase